MGCFDTPPGDPYSTAALAKPTRSSTATGVLVLADGTVLRARASAPRARPWARSASTPP